MRDAMLFDASLWEAESWDAPAPEDVVDRVPQAEADAVKAPVESETMLALLLPRPRRSH